jgi:hypothetical protein
MAKLEDDLGIAYREPVHVAEASAQDEGVVVEPEVLRITKRTSRICGLESLNSSVE